MTLQTQSRSDWKLLLAIGGFVVAGAVVIAIVAGTQAGREAADNSGSTGRPGASDRPSPAPMARAEAIPASSWTSPGDPDLKIPGSTVGAELAENVEAGPALPADALPPVDPDADFASVGHAAYGAREYRKAAAYWTAEVAARPERAYGHYMLGLSLWKAGEPEAAESALRRAGEQNPRSLRTFLNLSRVLNELDRFDAALEAAEQARSLDPEHPQALYVQARSLRNLGRVEDAVVALEQALAFDAEYGHARNLLGLIRIQQGRFAEAAESLRLAARYEPELPYVQANLGRALELDGSYEEAVLAFRAALDLDPGMRAAQLSLARVEEAAASRKPEEVAASAGEAVALVQEETGEAAPPTGAGGNLP